MRAFPTHGRSTSGLLGLSLPIMLSAGQRPEVVERGCIDPVMALPGVVAATAIELLKEPDHPCRTELAAECVKPLLANLIQG